MSRHYPRELVGGQSMHRTIYNMIFHEAKVAITMLMAIYASLEIVVGQITRYVHLFQAQVDPISWGNILNKVPELASVIVVVLYTLELSKVYRSSVQDIVKSQQDSSKAIMEDWRKHMEVENVKWREFISELRESQNLAIARLAEEMKENGKIIAAASETIARHEAKQGK